MILYPFLILLLIGVLYIVGLMLLRNSQDLVVLWGQSYTLELSSFTLVVGLILLFILGYVLIASVVALLLAPKRISQSRENKHHAEAQLDLKNGLVNLVEGHFAESEKLLVKNVAYSETPLLNYLGAAHCAHMLKNTQQRDEYLKVASAYGDEAEIAVAVSQASMQFESGQIEQSRATLTHLRELAPSHPYPNQLLAQVYYQQEDWRQLVKLIPELVKQPEGRGVDYEPYFQRAVTGLFESTSGKKDIPALSTLWQQLPDNVRNEEYAIEAYTTALNNAGGGELATSLLEQKISEQPSRALVKVYGEIKHRRPAEAFETAMQWQTSMPGDSAMLLCLGRLASQASDYTSSADYYERALSLVPDKAVYNEFAELLTSMGDLDNAQRCYRQGLRYCVQGKAQPFKRLTGTDG